MALIPLLLLAVLRIALRVALCFLIADLLVGLVHWAEDRYGSPDWPVIGALVIAPNLLHHAQPRAFLAKGWWRSADLQLLAGAAVVGLSWWGGWFSWELVLVLWLAINGNEVHKWAHRTPAENGRFITALQRWKLIQGRAHHGRHHGGDRDSHYCTLTCWVDALVERIGLWRGLERLIAALTGVLPRIDPVVAARRARAAA